MKNISLESWQCQLSNDIFFMKIETLLDELDAERCQFRKWDRACFKKNLINCCSGGVAVQYNASPQSLQCYSIPTTHHGRSHDIAATAMLHHTHCNATPHPLQYYSTATAMLLHSHCNATPQPL